MIILNNETIQYFKDYVSPILQIASDRITVDVRSIIVGKSSKINALCTSDYELICSEKANFLAVSDSTDNKTFIIDNVNRDYHYFLGSLGGDFNVQVDNTYTDFIKSDSLKGFFFDNLKVIDNDSIIKIYYLRFRRMV